MRYLREETYRCPDEPGPVTILRISQAPAQSIRQDPDIGLQEHVLVVAWYFLDDQVLDEFSPAELRVVKAAFGTGGALKKDHPAGIRRRYITRQRRRPRNQTHATPWPAAQSWAPGAIRSRELFRSAIARFAPGVSPPTGTLRPNRRSRPASQWVRFAECLPISRSIAIPSRLVALPSIWATRPRVTAALCDRLFRWPYEAAGLETHIEPATCNPAASF